MHRLVILLLLCAVPAAVQYCRHVRRETAVISMQPQHVVYELLGDVQRPGIYRYRIEQTMTQLADACGAPYRAPHDAGQPVAAGTRLTFKAPGIEPRCMDPRTLFSFGLPISLAAASAEDLELIPGIGPQTARAIIDYREHAGPVNRIGQLIEVRGIGPKTLEKIGRYLRP
jgi:competence ComEA-like helix-hairpin-helix protein